MINFKYDILFGLMFWEIRDIERKPHQCIMGLIKNVNTSKYHVGEKIYDRPFRIQHRPNDS